MATSPGSKKGYDVANNFMRANTLPPSEDIDGNDSDVEVLSSPPASTPGLSGSLSIKEEIKDITHSEEPSPGHRHKRQRLILEVVVPTWAAFKKETAEDFKKLKKRKNPIVKKIKNMDLLVDTVKDRLKPIGLDLFDITLDKLTQEFKVSRDFMAATYGGSMQATCPTIRKELVEKHGMDDFVYLNPDYQPEAPEVSGAPGLFFSTEAGADWVGIRRVFTRIESNRWQFMGMYEIKSSPSLSREEWAIQPVKVRRTWAKQICVQDWGVWVRVRVRARKEFGRQFNKDQFEEILNSGRYKTTTPEDVEKAYDTGKEKLGVWTMKCVGYDNAFQLQLCEKFPHWVPRPRNSRSSTKRTSTKKSRNSQSKSKVHKDDKALATRGRKRKRSASPDSDLTEPESEDSDEEERPTKEEMEFLEFSSDEEPELNLVYKSKGTRSRPICL